MTASLLPLEVYELSLRLSPLKLGTIAVNLAVVAYLLWAKRLFGLRGGVAAEHRERARTILSRSGLPRRGSSISSRVAGCSHSGLSGAVTCTVCRFGASGGLPLARGA